MRNVVRYGLYCAVSTLAITGLVPAAMAQVPSAQTQQAFPGRVDEQLRAPNVGPRVQPRVEVKEMAVQAAPVGADKIAFILKDLSLDGVTAYDEAELRGVYADKVGQKITLADLYGIAADMTRKYRNDGYILTQVVVPPQTIDGGHVRLRVVEGYIDRIEVRGDSNGKELIEAYARQIKTGGQAVNIRQLERSLLLINDLPGVDARSVLSPSRNQPGAADLLIITERKAYDAMIGADNFGTRYLGPLQVSAAGTLNSVLGLNERITGQLVLTPEYDLDNELAFFGFNYEQPIWDQGTTFEVFNNYTFTDPGYTLAQFDVSGRSVTFGARVNHPFVRSRNVNVTGRIGFDMQNINSKNNIETRREDNIRTVRAGGRFEFTDTLMSVAYNLLDVEVSRGVKLFGATDKDDPNVSRPAAKPDFTKIEIELQRLQRLTDHVNLLLGASGQMADGELYSSEEFGIGGQAYGRGFDPSEIVGDDGISGKIELQWNEPYHIELLDSYQLYTFFDAGHIWNGDAAVPSQETETATSTGFGIRGNFTPMTTAGIMVAVPLNRDVATMDDQDPRWFFNLSQRF